jgi:hypothetical protein
VLLEGVSYQFTQDIEINVSKYIAFLTANTLRRCYGGGTRSVWRSVVEVGRGVEHIAWLVDGACWRIARKVRAAFIFSGLWKI